MMLVKITVKEMKAALAALPVRSLKPTLKQRLEALPIDLLERVRSVCPGPFDSQLLERVAPLVLSVCRLQPGLASDRSALSTPKRRAAKVLMNGLVAFWNATFAECANLHYPEVRPRGGGELCEQDAYLGKVFDASSAQL